MTKTNKSRFASLVVAPILLCLLALSAPARADSATSVISQFNDTLLSTMQTAKKLGYGGRYEKLEPVVKSTFDLSFMTRYSAGRHWRGLSKQQKTQMIDAFSRLTIATYANRFKGYSGEKFHVLAEEEPRKNTKLVRTALEKSDGSRIKLNYLMRLTSQGWRIIDIFVRGTISELSTKRSEYSSTIKNKGFDGLLAIFEEKIAALGAKTG